MGDVLVPNVGHFRARLFAREVRSRRRRRGAARRARGRRGHSQRRRRAAPLSQTVIEHAVRRQAVGEFACQPVREWRLPGSGDSSRSLSSRTSTSSREPSASNASTSSSRTDGERRRRSLNRVDDRACELEEPDRAQSANGARRFLERRRVHDGRRGTHEHETGLDRERVAGNGHVDGAGQMTGREDVERPHVEHGCVARHLQARHVRGVRRGTARG